MKRDYRATYTVIRVDAAFLPLSKDAKLYWHTAKLELPVHGIGVCLPHTIAGLASMTVEEASRADAELVASNWTKREGAILWIVNGLRHTPNLSPNDEKHREYIRRLLTDLPRESALLAEFKQHYAEWFPGGPSDAPSEPHGSTTGSNKKEKEEREEPVVSGAIDLVRAANQGMRDNPKIGEQLNPIPATHGTAATLAERLTTAGVPTDFAVSMIYTAAKAYRPEGRNRQVRAMTYFADAVLSAWEKHVALEATDGARPPALPDASPIAGSIGTGEKSFRNARKALGLA